jgi:hypothetical protein
MIAQGWLGFIPSGLFDARFYLVDRFQDHLGIFVFILHHPMLQIGDEISPRILKSFDLGVLLTIGANDNVDIVSTDHTVQAVFVCCMCTQLLVLAEQLRKVLGVVALLDDLYVIWTLGAEWNVAQVEEVVGILHEYE